jgi:hypothetical protein
LNYLLKYQRQPRKLIEALPTLPRTVPDLYDHVMSQIIQGDDGSKDLALRTLSWVYYGAETRLLSMEELRWALVIEVGDKDIYPRQPLAEDIIAVCQSLVVCDSQTGIVRFTHYTVQEYFEHNCKDKLSPRVELAKVCVTCLAFDRFAALDDPVVLSDGATVVFYFYALKFWAYYTKGEGEGDFELQTALLRLFKSPRKRETLFRHELDTMRRWGLYELKRFSKIAKMRSAKSTTWMPIHIFAHAGLPTLINSFRKNLQQASKELEDHELDFGAVHSKDYLGATALIGAARKGHADVVRVLLEAGADKEETDEMGTSALCWSVQNGHVSVVKLLLEAKADVNSPKHALRMTPLIIALIFDHVEIVFLLLAAKASVQCKDTYLHMGPVWWCLNSASTEVVTAELLKAGADDIYVTFGPGPEFLRGQILRCMYSEEEIIYFLKTGMAFREVPIALQVEWYS